MPSDHPRTAPLPRVLLRTLMLLGSVLASVLGLTGCQAAQGWLQGDFRIDVQGKPAPVTHVYVVVASEAALEAAQADQAGYGGLVLGDLGRFSEFYEFRLAPDERLGRKWTPMHDEQREGLERLTEQEEEGAGPGGQLRLKISRKGFKANAENRIAIVAKYRSEDPWKGTVIPADLFAKNARAIVTLSDTSLNVYYSNSLSH